MKYIDAEKLKAEIGRRREKCADIAADERNAAVAEYYRGKEVAYDEMSYLITSLQQEQQEMDLEVREQIEELANDWHHKGFASDEDCPLCMQDLMDILWHFYELGLKVRKEEKNMKEQHAEWSEEYQEEGEL